MLRKPNYARLPNVSSNCMTTDNRNKIKNKKQSDEHCENTNSKKQTRMDKTGFYLCLVCGVLTLIAGLDMTLSEGISTGWMPAGRFSSGHQGSINGITAIIFGLVILLFPTIQLIKKALNKCSD